MSKIDKDRQEKRHHRDLTVAHIREQEGADSVEVVFLESARFYRLLKKNPAYDEVLKRLRDGMGKGHALKVLFASEESDIIEGVQA